MRQKAFIAGVGMTSFGKFPHVGLKELAAGSIRAALQDAGIEASELQAAYMGNAAAAIITGQVMIPGQVVLRAMGIGGIPVVNVENACATSATAFEQAATMITLGLYDCVLVAGVEKLYSSDKQRSFSVFSGAVDVESKHAIDLWLQDDTPDNEGAGEPAKDRSLFMDIYARLARRYARESGATQSDFALVSVKSSTFGSMNPKAQFRDRLTLDQVLDARVVAAPLTLSMCCPLGDGSAALVLVSERYAKRLQPGRCVRVLATVLASGFDRVEGTLGGVVTKAAARAYEDASIGPEDVNVVELHDATAPAELICYEQLGLCKLGQGAALIRSGATGPGGRVPVNTSGGLLRKGHPIGASGCGQLVELASQLRGECGARQVPHARIAVAENGGGWIGQDPATVVISILGAPE